MWVPYGNENAAYPSHEVQPYVYNNWYLLFFLDDCLLSWLDWNLTRTTDSHLKRIVSTNCCTHTVVPRDDGHRNARNMWRLTKYTKNKLCIKLVFLYTIISYGSLGLVVCYKCTYIWDKWSLIMTWECAPSLGQIVLSSEWGHHDVLRNQIL